MSETCFNCNLCAYTTNSFFSFRKHFVRHHKNDPNFYVACCIDACAYTSRNWSTYRVHVHRKHRNLLVEPSSVAAVSGIEGDGGSNSDDDSADVPNSNVHDPLRFNSLFTLSLAAKHNLSQSAVDNVVSSTDVLLENHLEFFKQQVKLKLTEINVDPGVIDEINMSTFMSAFASHPKRTAYYRQNIVTYVEPKEVIIGHKFISQSGCIKQSVRLGYIIPFEKSLRNLLSMPEVWHYVQNSHQGDNEYMHDICDGSFIRTNSMFSVNSTALQVILNCDDMEIVNPLGSHVKKHKITLFYYSLGNIPPEYRSRTDVIQLLAFAKTCDLRNCNGEHKLLADFCQTMNKMSSVGIDMDIFGDVHKMKGNLVIVCADTLAANWLGKFKEGVAFALRNCRHCEIENCHTAAKFVERDVALRQLDSHNLPVYGLQCLKISTLDALLIQLCLQHDHILCVAI